MLAVCVSSMRSKYTGKPWLSTIEIAMRQPFFFDSAAAPAAIFFACSTVISGPYGGRSWADRKSTRLNSSHQIISYAVFCLKKKNQLDSYRVVERYGNEGSLLMRSVQEDLALQRQQAQVHLVDPEQIRYRGQPVMQRVEATE